jgi:hypothetical protein
MFSIIITPLLYRTGNDCPGLYYFFLFITLHAQTQKKEFDSKEITKKLRKDGELLPKFIQYLKQSYMDKTMRPMSKY